MNKIKLGVLSLLSVFTLVGAVQVFQGDTAYAADCTTPKGCIQKGSDSIGGNKAADLGPSIKIVVNILLYILGAIAVIMIVIGGIRYTTSNGDASALTSAKNTILYAVVGLIVAIMAYSIVNFVLDSFK